MQLTDGQLITICLSIIIPISALLHSNSRISDTKTALSKEIEALKETLRAEMKTLKTEIQGEVSGLRADIKAIETKIDTLGERFENALKMHVLEHHK